MLNILDYIFLNLTLTVTCIGVLITNYEKYVPASIKTGFTYGCFAYRGSEANFLQILEIPKAYYKHFYLFSSILSSLSLVYMILVYFFGFTVNTYVTWVFTVLLQEEKPTGSIAAAIIAMSLFNLQCLRRLYETYYLQVFAKSSKMNITHYVVAIIHYFGCIVAAIGQAPLFCGDPSNNNLIWIDTKTVIVSVPCIVIFMWCWYQQYKTNVIFANLRKDKKTGAVVTEEHRIPRGRLFEHVSSPHRLCEVIMYTVLTILIPSKTFICICVWVLANQTQAAIHAHDWYKKTFKNYPVSRKAIIPALL